MELNGHRMQHDDGPTWCRDCGTFDFACEGVPCPVAGSGDFDSATERGAARIASELSLQFGIDSAPGKGGEPCF